MMLHKGKTNQRQCQKQVHILLIAVHSDNHFCLRTKQSEKFLLKFQGSFI